MNNQQFENQEWQPHAGNGEGWPRAGNDEGRDYRQQNMNTDPREQQGYNPPPISADLGEKIRPTPRRRRRRVWLWLIIGLVIIALLGTGVNAGLASFQQASTVTKTFIVGQVPTLAISDTTGSITIQRGNVGSLIIQATSHIPKFGSAPTVQYSKIGDTVSATVQGNSSGFLGFGSGDVDFNVTLPADANLQIHTDTGTIDVSGVSGTMSLTTDTGSINAQQDALSGQSTLTSNTGSVTFDGSINAAGNYLFSTDTGSVDVTLPGNSSFHVDASTDTGSINSDFSEVNVQQHNVVGADAHGDVGSSPSATVTLKTNTGSIDLHKGA